MKPTAVDFDGRDVSTHAELVRRWWPIVHAARLMEESTTVERVEAVKQAVREQLRGGRASEVKP